MKLELSQTELGMLLALVRKNPHETAEPIIQYLQQLVREQQLRDRAGAARTAALSSAALTTNGATQPSDQPPA